MQRIDAQDQKRTSSQFFLNTAGNMGERIPTFSPHDLDVAHFTLAQQSPQLVRQGKEPCPHCLKADTEVVAENQGKHWM